MGYVPEELMAFGDGQNDKSMLQYAGVGVAMGNAVQELKDAADEITVTCDEDGIAATLEKYEI
jgi:hydroxymethylpyrimidine pyrophosphatase-like HAD family hydrolase